MNFGFMGFGTVISNPKREQRELPNGTMLDYACFWIEADRRHGEKVPSKFLIEFTGNMTSCLPDVDDATGKKIKLFGARVLVVGRLTGGERENGGATARYVNLRADRVFVLSLANMNELAELSLETEGAYEALEY